MNSARTQTFNLCFSRLRIYHQCTNYTTDEFVSEDLSRSYGCWPLKALSEKTFQISSHIHIFWHSSCFVCLSLNTKRDEQIRQSIFFISHELRQSDFVPFEKMSLFSNKPDETPQTPELSDRSAEREGCWRLCLDSRSRRLRRTCVIACVLSTPQSHLPLSSSIYTPHFH